ncbi:MAG: tetratricopeptide repeat protein [Cyclobacteriaceae bacterium]|jgi:tetratricopeptide (TPR) repeat protein|nr:tetratricopeptide repeat protein [Cyclobacteriaceae bacterium]
MKILAFTIVIAIGLVACGNPKKETDVTPQAQEPVLTGLSGQAYFLPTWPPETEARLQETLRIARDSFNLNPTEQNYIWLGRRQAYLYQYRDAIATFTSGLQRYPHSYRLLRHRGHRYVTLRQFELAIADFQQAARLMEGQPLETEPDGQPNALNQPLSTTQFNVWYHLGLAYYLQGRFAEAEKAYLACQAVCRNDDSALAVADWLYMTYQRQGKRDEARKLLEGLPRNPVIVENDSYWVRLRLYRGEIPVDSVLTVKTGSEDADLALATQGYGVGNWYLYRGDTARARKVFKQVVGGNYFSAFGFIAAEAELARLPK